jgi:hypothetical protein
MLTGNNDISQDAGSSKEHILPLGGNGKGEENSDNTKQNGTEFWPPFFGYRLKVTDTLIVVFTAFLFATTFFLWLATRNLVSGADDASQRQLRAYVGVERMELRCTGFNNPNYTPVERTLGYVHQDFLVMIFKDFGLTPAYDVRIWVNWQPMPYPQRLPDKFGYPDQGMASPDQPQPTLSQHIVHKDQRYTAIIAIVDLRPFIATRNQQTMLYIYGHIDYRDIYRRRWQATFCQSWEPWSPVGVEFVPYSEHNDETEL